MVTVYKTRKGFLRKNIVAVSFFSKLYTNILIHILISSMNIYIYTCSVKIHCHYIIIYGQMSSHAEFQLPITF